MLVLIPIVAMVTLSRGLETGCRQAENWQNETCLRDWRRLGLNTDRLDLTLKLASDAYFAYDQWANNQTVDLAQFVNVSGEAPRGTKYNFTKENVRLFNGTTGTYGLRYTTPLGFVVYEPSELELALAAESSLAANTSDAHVEYLLQRFSARRLIALAFRGTRHMLYDLAFTDGSCRRVLAPGKDGKSMSTSFLSSLRDSWRRDVPKVHVGFMSTFESAFPQIEKHFMHFVQERIADLPHRIIDAIMRDTEVITTGHSLGGALAHIGGYVLGQRPDLAPTKAAVYTFSQPRVGNKQFVERMDQLGVAHFRILRKSDIVPKVPTFYYKHGGERLLLEDYPGAAALMIMERVLARHSVDNIHQDFLTIMMKNHPQALAENFLASVRSIGGRVAEMAEDLTNSIADLSQTIISSMSADENEYDFCFEEGQELLPIKPKEESRLVHESPINAEEEGRLVDEAPVVVTKERKRSPVEFFRNLFASNSG